MRSTLNIESSRKKKVNYTLEVKSFHFTSAYPNEKECKEFAEYYFLSELEKEAEQFDAPAMPEGKNILL